MPPKQVSFMDPMKDDVKVVDAATVLTVKAVKAVKVIKTVNVIKTVKAVKAVKAVDAVMAVSDMVIIDSKFSEQVKLTLDNLENDKSEGKNKNVAKHYANTWKLINSFYGRNKGYQLVKHLIDSYNDFIMRKLNHIIEGFNTIEIFSEFIPEVEKFHYIMEIDIKNPTITKPTITENDGSTKTMTPFDARCRNFTYSAPLYVDMEIKAKTFNVETNEYTIDTNTITKVELGKIPIMVNSQFCILKMQNDAAKDECRYDFGGYFIINGNEKVIISQDRIAENKTYVFVNNKVSAYSHMAEIRSVLENKFSVPKTTSLKLSSKPNQYGRYIRVNIHHIKNDIPIFILFRALGIESDKDIIKYILYDTDDKDNEIIMNHLVGSVEEANTVTCSREAHEYLSKYMNINGYPREILNNKVERARILHTVLQKEFLPHVGATFEKKALYLGYMVNKLIKCFTGILPYDDRDSYINKRIDTPGILMANLFRQYYGKVIKDMKNMISKEIHNGASRSPNKFSNVINSINVNKIVKSNIIESGLKYGLATGNWGIKSNKTKQGVAQVLNRLTYNSMASHLRRINTPIEKTGKLVQPRKLHGTQIGVICPAETPEGVSVGLVKNLSIIGSVSIASNSTNLRDILKEPINGIQYFDGTNIGIFANKACKVIINGDVVGVHSKPNELYAKVKFLKRKGVINVYTGVFWNIHRHEIWICTEGGRCIRPTYVINDNKIRLTQNHITQFDKEEIDWANLVIGTSRDEKVDDSVIEYMDVEECNMAMIAMRSDDLEKGFKGFAYPVKYTNLEMDPSLLLGVLAGCIPFSDHNQAPRNCYQSAMCKQAIGIYTSNFRKRYDTLGHVLNASQVPLVQTRPSKLINYDKLPSGINAIVAIATYTGFNQEDSIIMNKSSVDRGLFNTTYYRTYKEQNNRNHSTAEEEYFCKPDPSTTTKLKPFNYAKLGENGFVPENTFIKSGDVIIGKCMPQKQGSTTVNKDSSIALKNDELGFIDKNAHGEQDGTQEFTNVNGDGYTFAKVRIRCDRVPMIGDKFACYSPDHEVLTTVGWVPIADITMEHKVASLIGRELTYQKPSEVMSYDYDGEMYELKSNQVDLCVTPNHKMYVNPTCGKPTKAQKANGKFSEFRLERVDDICDVRRHYKKNADIWDPERVAPEIVKMDNGTYRFNTDNLDYDMDAWLTFLGIWMAEGNANNSGVKFAAHKSRVKEELDKCATIMGIEFGKYNDGNNSDGVPDRNAWRVHDTGCHLRNYMVQFSVGAVNKFLPDWVWSLDRDQCQTLIHGMCLGDGHTMKNGTRRYDTSSTQLADDFQRLCLHAGWSCNKMIKDKEGHTATKKDGSKITTTTDAFRLTIIETQNEPLVNKDLLKDKSNNLYTKVPYNDKVYCCTMPGGDGVIYVRRHGVVVFCGQSRHGQKGTVGMLYRQEDMPFTKDGITPDIIMNPHAVPSRMTIGQMLETIMGKACVGLGTFGDSTPFTDVSVEDIAQALESCGMERYGNEIMYNSRTGEQIPTTIFIGPTYYQRLKHMTVDKCHCLTDDHDVLTMRGWVPINQVTREDRVATLNNGELVYDLPTDVMHFPDYDGKMYHIANSSIDLNVTGNHRMWVSRSRGSQGSQGSQWSPYMLEEAKDIIGKPVRYMKNALWNTGDFQFVLPAYKDATEKVVKMDDWITFFGIWMTDGWTTSETVEIAIDNSIIEMRISDALQCMEYEFMIDNEKSILIVHDPQLHAYMITQSQDTPNWVWSLSTNQCKHLVDNMCIGNGVYTTLSNELADNFMRICLHAGWSSTKSKVDLIWHLSVIKTENNPSVNNEKVEEYYDFKGSVYCLQVPSQVFYVRRNGKACWTGNSRASNGPIVMLTRQPSDGRSRAGGLRLGEMEVECNWAHGMMQFLKERFMECSDNYRVFVCKKCGMMANVNPDCNIYSCKSCKNNLAFSEIRLPYACKLLFQEIQTMGIGTRFMV